MADSAGGASTASPAAFISSVSRAGEKNGWRMRIFLFMSHPLKTDKESGVFPPAPGVAAGNGAVDDGSGLCYKPSPTPHRAVV